MLSFNQQSVSGDNTFTEVWANGRPYWTKDSGLEFNNQIEPWPQQGQTGWHSVPPRSWQAQSAASYFQSFQSSASNVPLKHNQVQINQTPVHQPIIRLGNPESMQYDQLKSQAFGKAHQARTTLIQNTNGSFKTVVKRKRKRTMFTTEQVEALETVFRRKPYVTRDERQVLVQQLHITDTSVKVWFQNRRLRGKRELEQAIEEASEAYEDDCMQEESLYSTNSVLSSPEVSSNSYKTLPTYLDYIESELTQKADESGYITLDEKAVSDIVNAIDTVLPNDLTLDFPVTTEKAVTIEEEVEDVIETSDEVSEDMEDSDNGSVCAESAYEPISPAGSESADEETRRWVRTAPEKSLQRLFDIHFY